MNDNLIVFKKDNMLSILGIELNDNYDAEFFPESYGLNTTSHLTITSKNNESFSFVIENFESYNSIVSTFDIQPKLSSSGIATLPITMIHPKINEAMQRVNYYIKTFMAIYPVNAFNNQDHLTLTFHVEYTQDFEISNVTVLTELFKYYSWYCGTIDIIIEHYVNALLECVDIECITENSDISHIIELLKMQDLVTEMNMI